MLNPLNKKSSNRAARANSKIQQELGLILRQYLARDTGLVTISKVETSGDLRWAKIWISVFNGDDEKIMASLNSQIYQIQGEFNKIFSTKIIPRISFYLDTSSRYAQHIDQLIKKIRSDN